MVFIQFAGFTFGKSASAFATPWHGYPGNNSSFLLGGHDTVTGVNNIQYTAQFGNGVSGTIGLDDPTVFDRTAIFNLAASTLPAAFAGPGITATGTVPSAYGGVRAPDIVGNIRVDQAWGLFQISGSAHLVNASYNTLGASAAPTTFSEISGHPDDKWGGSVMAALQIKNIPTGPGDDIKIDATYAVGKTKDVISSSSTSPNFLIFGPAGGGGVTPGAYQSLGFGATTDAVYLPVAAGGDGSLHLTTAWGVRGAFNHNWDPYWSTSLFGSYSGVRYDNTAKGYMCGAYLGATGGLATKSADYSCNPDFNVSQLGAVTRWTPVKNLTFSAEVMWFHLDQKFTGSSTIPAGFAPKPSAIYNFADQDVVSFNVRAQRNF
jgi:porin-like protein